MRIGNFVAEGFRRFGEKPARSLWIFTAVSGLIWVVQTSLCQKILPLDVIEAIVWGEQLQWGQMKSPPLSGWVAYGFSLLSGHADWALYLAAQLCTVCGIWFTYKLAREFFDECEAATAALLLYFLFYYMPPSMKFCSHDTQIALLPAIGFFFWRSLRDDRLRDWLACATVSALAVLGKYSAAQLLLGCLAFMVCTRLGRSRFKSAGPYLAGGLFLLLLLPHLRWLFHHDFLSVRHMEDRVANPWCWTDPLEAAGNMLMPVLVGVGALLIAGLPWKRLPRRTEPPNTALAYALTLTFVPGGIYLLLSLSGHSIVMQWYSYLASFSGIAAVALMPWKIDPRTFRRLLVVLWLYFVVLLVVVTADVMLRPRRKIHTDPRDIAQAADRCFREQTGRPIPVVYGHRWLAGVVENYLPYRPPACADQDVCALELHERRMRREGALIVFDAPQQPTWLLRRRNAPPLTWRQVPVVFRAPAGRTKTFSLYLAVLPPERETETGE